MRKKTLIKIYEYGSFLLLIATCVVALAIKNPFFTLWGLILSLGARLLAERTRRIELGKENEMLKNDLRRLTQLLGKSADKEENK